MKSLLSPYVTTSSSDVGEKREKGEPSKAIFSHLSHRGNKKMVQCFGCCNLIKSWKPTTKQDWLFEDRWKCKVTEEQLVEYYLIKKERECKHYEKRPKLLLRQEYNS